MALSKVTLLPQLWVLRASYQRSVLWVKGTIYPQYQCYVFFIIPLYITAHGNKHNYTIAEYALNINLFK